MQDVIDSHTWSLTSSHKWRTFWMNNVKSWLSTLMMTCREPIHQLMKSIANWIPSCSHVWQKPKIFEQPIESKFQSSVERWSISSLLRNFRESDKPRQCSVWVWTMSGWYKWVSCTFWYWACCTFWRALNPILKRTKVLLICSAKPQRAMDKHPDQPVRDPRLCKQSKTM